MFIKPANNIENIMKTIKDAGNEMQILYSSKEFFILLIFINAFFNITAIVEKIIIEIGIPKLKAISKIKLWLCW